MKINIIKAIIIIYLIMIAKLAVLPSVIILKDYLISVVYANAKGSSFVPIQ